MPPNQTTEESGSLPVRSDETLLQEQAEVEHARALSRQRATPPGQIPGYRIQRCLGEGSYGSVWLAYEHHTGKYVAVKFYTHRRGLDWSLLNREVEKLAVLYTSRDIVDLLDVGWEADPPYYVMEYLENGSLAHLLENGPLPVKEAVRIARAVLQGLVHAHGSGILHCDLKPGNVLLDAEFAPRLADFGQSRLTHEQLPALGTLFFMAPEQADLEAVPDARWDVYALGAVLYQCLTGEAPHRTPANESAIQQADSLDDRLKVYRRTLRHSPRPAAHREVRDVDRTLAEIVDRCLEVDPARRFPNAQAVLEALDARERQLTRRPLLTLGIVLPILLFLATFPLLQKLMSVAVRSTRESLTARALESDAVTARILARSMERELDAGKAELVEVADDAELVEAIQAEAVLPWPERTQLRAVLADWQKKFRHPPDISWLVTARDGVQIYRNPPSETIDKNYSKRDYFHGRQANFSDKNTPANVAPLDHPYISLPFHSEATDSHMVAISVPVWDLKHQTVIAVLSRTLHLGQMLTAYKAQAQSAEQVERILALVDGHNYDLLDHPWMEANPEQFHDLRSDSEFHARARLGEKFRVKVAALQAAWRASRAAGGTAVEGGHDREEHYQDPIGQLDPKYARDWLAAFWPVGDTGWTAIVQERRDDALRPVDQMEDSLIRYARFGYSLLCLLIAAVWYFIYQALLSRDRVTSPRGNTPGTARIGKPGLSDT